MPIRNRSELFPLSGWRLIRSSFPAPLCMLCVLCVLFMQTGCVNAVVGIAAAGVATVRESMEDAVERSYPQPYWCVYRATHAALYEMSMPIQSIVQDGQDDTFHARTTEYPVTVELHSVTDAVTRVRVVAGGNVFQQDEATARAVADAIHAVISRNLAQELTAYP